MEVAGVAWRKGSASRGWRAALTVLIGIFFLPVHLSAQEGSAENLIERFRTARFEAQLERFMQDAREHARASRVVHLSTSADTLRPWLAKRWTPDAVIEVEEEPEPVFEVTEWRLLRRFEHGWFQNTYNDTRWAYLGHMSSYDNPAPIDTSLTKRLRAHLQSHFGDPTYTLVERGETQPAREGGAMQFEYWFIVNDSIPVKVIDPNGPLDRGIVLVTDNRWRDSLPDMRVSFLEEIMEKTEPSPYVDFYFDEESNRWYRVGYDGRRYFKQAIRPPSFRTGRPRIERVE